MDFFNSASLGNSIIKKLTDPPPPRAPPPPKKNKQTSKQTSKFQDAELTCRKQNILWSLLFLTDVL